MALKFNPKEKLDDLIAEGYTRTLALLMVKEEAKRRHQTEREDVKQDNDYRMSRHGLHPLRKFTGVE